MAKHNRETTLPGERLLAMGEREIGKGNLREGAGLVWRAVMETLAAVAEGYGMPCRNREEAVKVVNHLDDIAMPPPPGEFHYTYRNLMAFSVAETYREHCEELDEFKGTEFEWDPDEYLLYLDSVRRFIDSLNHYQKVDTAR
ncbi:MAG: hypothetical protein F4X64_15320 [Chloroflexi bacterium]|nr:hypothetical protein [Chloroflexota bacterium]